MSAYQALIDRATCSLYDWEAPDHYADKGGFGATDASIIGTAAYTDSQAAFGSHSLAAQDNSSLAGLTGWLAQYSAPFTVTMWVRRMESGLHYVAGNALDVFQPMKGWNVRWNEAGRLQVAVSDGTEFMVSATSGTYEVDEWVFLAFTFAHGRPDGFKLYEPSDGSVIGPASTEGWGSLVTNTACQLLSTLNINGLAGHGWIDQVALFSEELSAAEIGLLKDGPLVGDDDSYEELVARETCGRYDWELPDHYADKGGRQGQQDCVALGTAGATDEQAAWGQHSIAAEDGASVMQVPEWLLQFDFPFTVCMWVYRTVDARSHYIAGNTPDAWNRPATGWGIRWDEQGRLGIAIDDGTGDNRIVLNTPGSFAPNTWHFVAFSWAPGFEQGCRLYEPNGELSSTGSTVGMGGARTNSAALLLGTGHPQPLAGEGFIDEVLFFEQQLSDNQISTLAQGPGGDVPISLQLEASAGGIGLNGGAAALTFSDFDAREPLPATPFLLRSIRNHLFKSQTLRGMLYHEDAQGMRIYVGRMPQEIPFPAVVMQDMGGDIYHLLLNQSRHRQTQITFDVYGKSYPEVLQIAEALRMELSHLQGVIEGSSILGCMLMNDRAITDNPLSGTDDWRHRYSVDYSIHHLVPQPKRSFKYV